MQFISFYIIKLCELKLMNFVKIIYYNKYTYFIDFVFKL